MAQHTYESKHTMTSDFLIIRPLGDKSLCPWVDHKPDFKHRFVDMNEFSIYAEFEVGCFRAVKLFFQWLGNRQEIILLYKQSNRVINTHADTLFSTEQERS